MAKEENIARAMAAAPVTVPTVQPTEGPKARTNRCDKLFTSVTFQAVANRRVWEAEKAGGQKSMRLANVIIESCVPGIIFHGTVRAIQQPGDKEAYPQFTFISSPYTRQTSVTADPEVDGSTNDLQAWKDSLLDRYVDWSKNHDLSATTEGTKRSIGLTL